MSRRLREIVLLALGVITPIGILAVNVSAFVMGHLAALRLIVAGCALVSGLVLNGLTAWWVLRLASRNATPLYREYRTWLIGAAVLIVAATAGAGGYLTYLGMRDPSRLPDNLSMVVASFMLLLPLGVAFASRRAVGMGGIIPVDEPTERTGRPHPAGRYAAGHLPRKAGK